MAQPISLLPPHPNGASADRQLHDAPHQHADAIVSALELLQLLHDRGVEYFLGNAGTDFASIVDAFARFAAEKTPAPIPGVSLDTFSMYEMP